MNEENDNKVTSIQGETNNRTEEKTVASSVPPNFSQLVDKVLSNPEILSTVASALSGSDTSQKETGTQASNVQNEQKIEQKPTDAAMAAFAEKLPEIMKLISPSSTSNSERSDVAAKLAGNDKRGCLLAAIKPYLNDERREAVDYIIKFSRLADIIKTLG